MGFPVTGASSMATPLALARSAMALDISGAILLMSIRVSPGCAPSSTPFAPQQTSSEARESVTMVITTSEAWARARGELPHFAPAANKLPALSAVRFQTVRE